MKLRCIRICAEDVELYGSSRLVGVGYKHGGICITHVFMKGWSGVDIWHGNSTLTYSLKTRQLEKHEALSLMRFIVVVMATVSKCGNSIFFKCLIFSIFYPNEPSCCGCECVKQSHSGAHRHNHFPLYAPSIREGSVGNRFRHRQKYPHPPLPAGWLFVNLLLHFRHRPRLLYELDGTIDHAFRLLAVDGLMNSSELFFLCVKSFHLEFYSIVIL